ncbi:MAG: PepSY domain-containing protein [Acetobacteraceae bacterium]|nr:PepSY domain-containing protein [Acetobacteraceae bacterium]
MRLLVILGLLTVIAVPARADRPVTAAERERLVAALSAQGCSGGKMEWDDDDQEFEVDNASCSDGQRYDLKFDAQFRLKAKKLDD